MKKYLLMLSMLLPAAAFAQTTIEEHFDGSSGLEWTEFSEKKTSALIQDGCMVLKPGKKTSVLTKVRIPIETDYDFTVDVELFFPKFSVFSMFSIVFNDESFVQITSGRYALTRTADGTQTTQRIKLNYGKNVTVNACLKRTTRGCALMINNMEVAELPLTPSLTGPELAFVAAGMPMHIKSMKIEQ